jgi:hypothetical protein
LDNGLLKELKKECLLERQLNTLEKVLAKKVKGVKIQFQED